MKTSHTAKSGTDLGSSFTPQKVGLTGKSLSHCREWDWLVKLSYTAKNGTNWRRSLTVQWIKLSFAVESDTDWLGSLILQRMELWPEKLSLAAGHRTMTGEAFSHCRVRLASWWSSITLQKVGLTGEAISNCRVGQGLWLVKLSYAAGSGTVKTGKVLSCYRDKERQETIKSSLSWQRVKTN